MKTKELEALTGTDYEVVVSRDLIGDYDVEVRKPADTGDPYVEYETVALRHLDGDSSEYELNRLVRGIIESDRPSLVGVYAYTEESNGN
jgi:hypothetical protein